MIGLIQRVKSAYVEVIEPDNNDTPFVSGEIQNGLLLLLGVEKNDTSEHVNKLARKVANLRIFEDIHHKMNLSIQDISGELLVVSQFTLAADTQKGNRPGFSNAASGNHGALLYNEFVEHYNTHFGKVQTGRYGANMQVHLVNDGPATFILNV